MTNRVKTAIAGIISCALGLFVNIMMIAFTTLPPWVATVSALIVAIAGALGFAVTKIAD